MPCGEHQGGSVPATRCGGAWLWEAEPVRVLAALLLSISLMPAEARAGVRYVRLVSARVRTNPDTGAPFPHDPLSDGPDVDGVYVRHVR